MIAAMPETANMRPATLKKYQAIHARFNVLYNTERKRIDDVETQLCQEFFIGRHRLLPILKMDIPKEVMTV